MATPMSARRRAGPSLTPSTRPGFPMSNGRSGGWVRPSHGPRPGILMCPSDASSSRAVRGGASAGRRARRSAGRGRTTAKQRARATARPRQPRDAALRAVQHRGRSRRRKCRLTTLTSNRRAGAHRGEEDCPLLAGPDCAVRGFAPLLRVSLSSSSPSVKLTRPPCTRSGRALSMSRPARLSAEDHPAPGSGTSPHTRTPLAVARSDHGALARAEE